MSSFCVYLHNISKRIYKHLLFFVICILLYKAIIFKLKQTRYNSEKQRKIRNFLYIIKGILTDLNQPIR